MLIEFSVGNFLSFRDKKTLSLVAAGISEAKESNVLETNRLSLLNGAVIYGANSSGKSNFIKAMSTMRRIVLFSLQQQSVKTLDIKPFLLNTETESQPSFFEIVFETEGIRYRYGFEITNKEIVGEWLYETKKNADKLLYIRQNDGIEVTASFKEGKDLESKTRNNALFLAVVDQFNGQIAKRIMKWFNSFITISGLNHEMYQKVTFDMLENKDYALMLNSFYEKLDLGFDRLKIEKVKFNPKELPEDMPEPVMKLMVKDLEGAFRYNISTTHKQFNKNNEPIGEKEFDMRSQESAGTNKVFNLSGVLFDVLNNGGVLVVDELDASLHPLLTRALTRLFNKKENNIKNAQLIFTTHDTNVMNSKNWHYRRDQIYFIEKDKYGASDLFSLAEYKEKDGSKIRKDRSFEPDYLQGKYGSIPVIGEIKVTFP